MPPSSRRNDDAGLNSKASSSASSHRSGQADQAKHPGSKQAAAYRRWDQPKPAPGSKPVPDSSVEEQISRANTITDIEMPEFTPQSFLSKKPTDEMEIKAFGQKLTSRKPITPGVLGGPVENLISPILLPKTEEERNILQAQMLTALRKEILCGH